jgi:hypothetical protein
MQGTHTAYKKVGGSVQFDSSLLSITFGSGGQGRGGKCPPSYMPKTLCLTLKDTTENKRTENERQNANPSAKSK